MFPALGREKKQQVKELDWKASSLVHLNPRSEIEKTCRRNNTARRARIAQQNNPIGEEGATFDLDNMADVIDNERKVMREYTAPSLDGYVSSITRPPVAANNF
ncbi:hypothetical protein PIB30_099490 [Stylosanthes scabra]|uniref:Uncharacterized protein n=1 Tax=Stylosanthes scabra TaxID=79078 RepID=A0ABU6TXL8_9FABA|nr:hypothetical protein [Stylosanthes scabra]